MKWLIIASAGIALCACQKNVDQCVADKMKAYDQANPKATAQDRSFFEGSAYSRCMRR